MFSKKIIFTFVFLNICLFCSEKSLSEKWVQANNFFKQAKTKQQYEEAVSNYKEILKTGIKNGHLLYNLGNAYLKIDRADYAILYYKRAQKHLGNDPYLIENLKFAKSIVGKKIQFQQTKPKSTFQYLFFWHFYWQYETRFFIFVIIHSCFWLLLTLKLTKLKFPFWNFFIIVTILLIAIGGSIAYDVFNEDPITAVLIGDTIEIRKGDAPTYELLYGDKKIYGGVEVEILEQRNNWTKVKLPDGLFGWVKNKSVEKV